MSTRHTTLRMTLVSLVSSFAVAGLALAGGNDSGGGDPWEDERMQTPPAVGQEAPAVVSETPNPVLAVLAAVLGQIVAR